MRSSETGLLLGALGADVGLDVTLLDSGVGTEAEMSLGLTHGRSSEKESVGAFYNYILD